MKEVHQNLFVSNLSDCSLQVQYGPDWVTVHACKHPCHQTAVGYSGNLPKTDPNYLILEKENDLFMNLVDPETPLFMPQSFQAFFAFLDKKWDQNKKVLIHCNQGESRAPSLALLFMAKKLGKLSNESYESAVIEFVTLYPEYRPGRGIQTFLTKNWRNPQLLNAPS